MLDDLSEGMLEEHGSNGQYYVYQQNSYYHITLKGNTIWENRND